MDGNFDSVPPARAKRPPTKQELEKLKKGGQKADEIRKLREEDHKYEEKEAEEIVKQHLL